MDRRSPTAEKGSPLLESDYIQKKNGEISRIVTDTDVMQGQRCMINRATTTRRLWQLSKHLID
jgi:hypothetical protein